MITIGLETSQIGIVALFNDGETALYLTVARGDVVAGTDSDP